MGRTLLTAFLLLTTLPLSLLAFLTYNQIERDTHQKLITSLETMASLKEAHLVDWIESYERELILLASAPDLETHLASRLKAAQAIGSSLTALTLLDRRTGEVITATGLTESDLQTFQPSTLDERRLIIAPTSTASDQPLLAISYAWADRRLIGLLHWDSLWQIITASDDTGEDVATSLVTGDGEVISARGVAQLPQDTPKTAPQGPLQALQGHNGSGTYTNLEGVPVFGAYRWNPELQIALLVEQPQTQAFAAGSTLTAMVVGATLAVALITAAIASVVTRRVTRPIVQLTETAAWMARGDLNQKVTIARKDEIGVLARAFNRMAAELRVLYGNLEAKVAERTKQLEEASKHTRYYVMQLAISAEVARVATSIRDLDVMLRTVVELIGRAFELHRASIYLLDDSGEWAVWQVASNAVHPLSRRIAVGGPTLVGRVAADGERRVVRVGDSAGASDAEGSFQPPVACEMATPLRVQERVLGVLHLQSSRRDDFGESDHVVYQSLADQISIAIENLRAYAVEHETVRKLRELDRIQSQFLTNMSHALRTPLTSIIGFSQVMLKDLDGPLTELQRTDLTTVYESGRQLLGLINDMLELSQLELGVAPFSSTEVNLAEIIEGVMATARALARGKPVRLYEEVPADLPTLHTDGQRVRQVILALLTNAVKFTDKGTITLRVTSDDSRITISVSDSGAGIPQAERARIFSDARYGETVGDEAAGADELGFGLAISKRVVERLGGRIWVESQEGVGSSFTFTLPLRPVQVEPI